MPVFPDKGGPLRELLSVLAGSAADQVPAVLAQLSERLGGLRIFPVFASGRTEWDDHVAAGRAWYSGGYLNGAAGVFKQCVQLWNPSKDTDILVFDAAAEIDDGATIPNVSVQMKLCGTQLNSAVRGVVTNARGENPGLAGNKGIIVAHDGAHDLAGAMAVARIWYPGAVDTSGGTAQVLTPELAPGAIKPRLLARLGPNTGLALEDRGVGGVFGAMIFGFAWAEVPRGTT